MVVDEDIAAALIAGVRDVARAEIMPRFRKLAPNEIGTKSGPDDFVTIADRLAEEGIASVARQILPDAQVIGEESVADRPALLDRIGDAETCVIIDPIDGTGNYAAGIAVFGVILAVVHRGRTEFGLLYDPVMDDWVAALRGQGAWYQTSGYERQQQLHTRRSPPLEQASGFVAPNLYPHAEREKLLSNFSRVDQLRFLRCSCHEYRQMVLGHADFIVSPSLKPWDHAAGLLALESAGGVALVDGAHAYAPAMREGYLIAAGSPALMPELLRISGYRAHQEKR